MKYNNENVKLCYKDACINAVGNNGKLIAAGVFILLVSIALYNLSRIQ